MMDFSQQAPQEYWSLPKKTAWRHLQSLSQTILNTPLSTLFAQDSNRAKQCSVEAAGIHLDYSKNWITHPILDALVQLLSESGFSSRRKALLTGKLVNFTENRAALHTELRRPDQNPEIKQCFDRLCELVNQPLPFTDLVHIGIGGSDLGPRLCVQALRPYHLNKINLHFVSNADPADFYLCTEKLNPASTAFVFCSKSFGTEETLHNAALATSWLKNSSVKNIHSHLFAITANAAKAQELGIRESHIFPLWDWVGGRYSIWSAVGLPLMLAIGMDGFKQFLSGAHDLDVHFKTADPKQNLPVLLGLLSVWYSNFCGAQTQAVIPYSQLLEHLPAYLQQLVMESNGKCMTDHNQPTTYTTGSIVWGSIGTNSQHSFHQLLHQGTHLCPVDFVLPLTNHYGNEADHHQVIANCLAQARALMTGQTDDKSPHKMMPGNRPSNIISFKQLTPYTLGALIAIYEHKTFVESCIWSINAFDQWGVELGKKISFQLQNILTHKLEPPEELDSSTRFHIETLYSL